MKVYNEITLSNRNFEFWGSAKENAESLTNGQLDTVEAILEDLYPEGISATQLNDIFPASTLTRYGNGWELNPKSNRKGKRK